MNSIIESYYPTFEQYQAVRKQLMELLSDEDLSFKVEGNPSLGELCKQIGETEFSYLQGFKTFKLTFDYKNEDLGLATSVERLTAWYAELDKDLRATIEALSQEEVESKTIDRGGWELPVQINLTVYTEALLIFYGKVWVYLNAMGKELPKQWQEWIG
ncbi:MAG: hypothetical protein DWQ07_00990 [Chloroflexi bacterium]|nr:MAG: hypothetical protein DWQ07_00990 [Chloroflexota bacterium]MBL1196542.1 hypothetical protein [Chloroflexota bacterium]NOH13837.1 hypothetical protein [Chloroflexota bacterium]